MENNELSKLKELTRALVSKSYLSDQTASWEYAFNSVNDLVCITNTSYEIKFLNDKFLKKFPDIKEDYINKDINSLFVNSVSKGPDGMGPFDESEVVIKESFYPELGGWFIKHWYKIRNKENDVIGYTFMFSDVTSIRRAEAKCKISEKRFHDLFNHMPVSAIIFEAVSSGKDFKICNFNKAAEGIDLIDRNEVIDKNVSSFPLAASCDRMIPKFKKVFLSGKPEQIPTSFYDNELIKGWRETFILKLPSGEIVSLYTDETFKVKITQDLEKSEKLLQCTFDCIPDIIGLQDNQHNAISYNKTALKKLNLSHKEIKGMKCYEVLGRSDPCTECRTNECLSTKKPSKHLRYIEELKGWYDCRSYPVLGPDNEVSYIVEHLRDVTDLYIENERKEEEYLKNNELFQRLSFIISASNGYVCEKKVVGEDKELVYSYIDPSLCKDFYKITENLSEGGTKVCEYAIGKTSTELLSKATSKGSVHTFLSICEVTDRHCIEQRMSCSYYEMGYIENSYGESEWIVIKARKEPVLNADGEVTSVLGFLTDCSKELSSIREIIMNGLKDGTIEKIDTVEKTKVYWIVGNNKDSKKLTHLDFP